MSAGVLLVLAAALTAAGAWLLSASPERSRLRRLTGRAVAGRGACPRAGGIARLMPEAEGRVRPWPEAGGRMRGSGSADQRGGSAQWDGADGPSADAAGSLDALAFDLDLVAICLLAGLPADRALEHAAQASADRSGLALVARALRLGTDAVRGLRPELQVVETLIRFSGRTGVALAPLLSAHAAELRASEHRRRQIAAARLGVVLVLPLGVCVLPAFILLGVVPVLLTLVGDLLPALGGGR
ncbi:type II secretion system F family protein [Brevibacterium sp.]|uniref:type II secretion system F family protein n=1 Tax=Brevibacterium sp. TaxID=1701 RepID=UPI0025C3ADCD|nr:type II secretion system F family protein [Brevibacterium sp.]